MLPLYQQKFELPNTCKAPFKKRVQVGLLKTFIQIPNCFVITLLRLFMETVYIGHFDLSFIATLSFALQCRDLYSATQFFLIYFFPNHVRCRCTCIMSAREIVDSAHSRIASNILHYKVLHNVRMTFDLSIGRLQYLELHHCLVMPRQQCVSQFHVFMHVSLCEAK